MAKFSRTVDVWAVSHEAIAKLQRGQWVSAGPVMADRSNCGVFCGVKPSGSIVVAWNGNARGRGYASYRRALMDCVVRAFSVAANRPYAEIHTLCATHGRPYGRGTSNATMRAVAKAMGIQEERTLLAYVSINGRLYRPTLAAFIKANPTGRFVLTRRGHAFALIDGVVHDWAHGTGARSRITKAFRIIEED